MVRPKQDFVLFLTGILLILDGIGSIVYQLNDPFLFQLGRAVRIVLGLAIIYKSHYIAWI